jgi:hypothetical protein
MPRTSSAGCTSCWSRAGGLTAPSAWPTNRTHQACAGVPPVTTDCRGERRFISTIARRLDALGALTRGQRQTGGQNLFDPADNLESDYAREALTRWYHLLHQGKLTSIGFADFCERTGLQLEQEGCLTDNLPPIQRWLNRILALPIAQNASSMNSWAGRGADRCAEGHLDAGVETLVADKLTIIEERILREDANGASTQLHLEAQWAPKFTPLAEIVKRIGPKTGAAQWPVLARGAADPDDPPDGRWHAGRQLHAASPWRAELDHRR